MNSPTYKAFQPVCPVCGEPLRKRTLDELVAEGVRLGDSPEFVLLALGARTGNMAEWWCTVCNQKWSPYSLLRSQKVVVSEQVPAGEIWIESGGKRTRITNIGKDNE